MANQKVIRFIVAVLDDDQGINNNAMQCLRDLDYDDRIADIINQCECCDGRWYLPEKIEPIPNSERDFS